MAVSMVNDSTTCDGLGPSFRAQTPGPEFDLVNWFLTQGHPPVPNGCRASIFREPRIDSGFPDLVIVIWSERRSKHWNPRRAELQPQDFKLLHLLVQEGRSTARALETHFNNSVAASIERLEAAGLVRRSGCRWVPVSISRIFSATRIIAIEAKIDERQDVIEQAFLNTWFASHSYILLPKPPKNQNLLQSAASLGVGVLSRNERGIGKYEPACPGRLPRSYASWLFNEWAWRASTLGVGSDF